MKSPSLLCISLALLIASSAAVSEVDCSRQVKCLTNYAPVCGSDGESYSNQCVFDNAVCLAAKTKTKLTKLFGGPCDLSPNPFCGLRCTSTYVPVCGTDGNTYANSCTLQGAKCSNVTVSAAHTGACTTPKPTPTPSPTSMACSDACPMIFLPVCGSDGVTYPNQCVLDTAACQAPSKSPLLTKASDGPCPTKSPTPESCERGCPKIYMPQCGSDGKTYNNDCLFQIGQCVNASLTVAYGGRCATQASACAAMSCKQFTECKLDTSTGKGYCADICTAGRCAKNEICTLKHVQCFTTPCPPVATCTKRS